MSVIRLLAFSSVACCMAALIRAYKPELMIPFLLAAGAVLLLSVMEELSGAFSALRESFARYGLNAAYIEVAIKVIAIAYLVQFGANMCRDANESALAGKVEMAGRVLILSSAVPVILRIMEVLGEFAQTL